jgi:hypothetical protein
MYMDASFSLIRHAWNLLIGLLNLQMPKTAAFDEIQSIYLLPFIEHAYCDQQITILPRLIGNVW